jgi:membrane protease YdiL (CAAX protease family)
MKDRRVRIGALAGALFVINLVARAIAKFGFGEDTDMQDRISLVFFGVIAVVLVVVVFRWGRDRPVGVWLSDVLGAMVIGCLATVLIGPAVFGGNPVGGGPGEFFAQIWLYAGFGGGGVVIGYLLLVVLGKDYRSRQLAAFSEAKLSKPRRVVRR